MAAFLVRGTDKNGGTRQPESACPCVDQRDESRDPIESVVETFVRSWPTRS